MINPVFPRERLEDARALIASSIHRTPLLHSRALSDRVGAPVFLKCENLQKTGAFKVRGALHRLLRLSDEARERGVATVSAGNHAQAVAWAASAAGIKSLVVMPEKASPMKVTASREYGAEVVLHGDARAAFSRVLELADERGMTFVHPFDDEEVVAGHASCGLEIVEDLPDVNPDVLGVPDGIFVRPTIMAVFDTIEDTEVFHSTGNSNVTRCFCFLAATGVTNAAAPLINAKSPSTQFERTDISRQ